MQCQFCANPATVHLTTIVDGQKTVQHLCEACARQHYLVEHHQAELNIKAAVHFMLTQQLGPEAEELSRLTCPECSIKYMEFRAEGRLGCPRDYEAFRRGLEPLLKRVHRAVRHVGKRPPHYQQNRQRLAELYELHRRLCQAVEDEQYELAAQLRDLIRARESFG
jgi:protein arginine kinase activator